MRRLLAIALLTAVQAAAQIHGVPPSVTSITPTRSTPGVPASVTSLGPNGFVDPMFRPSVDPMFLRQPVDPMFRNPAFGNFGNGCCVGSFRFHGSFGNRPHHHHRSLVPVYVPYYYPYYAAYSDTYAAPASTAEYEAEDEEPPAPTIYERRSRTAYSTDASVEDRYGEHYTDYREQERRRARAEAQSDEERQAAQEREQRAEAEKARAEAKPEAQEPATVLVFKDGHRQDLRGYAITGDVIYDLDHGRARKILLADLDLPATIKLNDQLGNDFRLPSRPAKQN